ncbi:TonB-dependent receptor [Croceicoccus sediminis]|uniref:TonB-dependent receptor n=1 Tax=Croceicoccus sediminis TaxID=2571150 RepID=UPI001478D6CA|nr:TonB-dependent receptor [Croceicoccus sediminis]
MSSTSALAQEAEADAGSYSDPIIVTAQKRSQSIQDVGMSITAISSDDLTARGVTDVEQLTQVVPGFNFNTTSYGTPVYTIRGVGFQENSLGASPTVSVYVDEVGLPFSIETLGSTLDLERVEVLKGPQGTLYGQNATGGAINYIAAKPTDYFTFGGDVRYGRFNAIDLNGFVSGPLSDTLRARAAVRLSRSGPWQKSYSRDDKIGETDQLVGRLLVDWEPDPSLKISLNVNGWRDRSDTQVPQHVGKFIGGLPDFQFEPFYDFPFAPENARAADWDPGLSFAQDSKLYQITGRADYEISDSLTVTSISSYHKYDRYMPVDQDGTPFENFRNYLGGDVESFFQELRLSGTIGSSGNWIVGANYQNDDVFDTSTLYNGESTQSFLGGTSQNDGRQKIKTKAVYGNFDLDITDSLNIQAGARYTDDERTFRSCTRDIGDGKAANSGIFPGTVPGGCLTFLEAGVFGEVFKELKEDNVSWRVGLNYKLAPQQLLYANVSRGYKSGSFPLLGLAFEPQATPVTQESVLAYEVGAKLRFSRAFSFNVAGFYYDYTDKQTRGNDVFPIFGNLELLVNIPKSRVLGFEAEATLEPFEGLTIAPSITMISSKIRGDFFDRTSNGIAGNFGGEPFPYTPKWSGNTTIDYRTPISDDLTGFVGGNVNYRSSANGSFGELDVFRIAPRAIVDLRAGIEGDNGQWRASIWGENVFNKYYFVTKTRISDAFVNWTGRPVTYGVSFSYKY